jgi:adenylate cyclase
MFVMATAIDNILNNRAVRETPRPAAWLLIVVMATLPALLVASSRSILVSAGLSAAIVFAYALLCVLFYARDLWLPMTAPLLAAIVSLGANSAYRYFNADRELSRTRRTLEAYVSPQLVRHVMDNLESIRFDGQKRRLTILFSDVRGFTTLTEHTDPVELLKQLNQYLEAMTDIVFKYDGILDKFIGDGLMAHWGAFTPDRPNAELAARAALEMMTRLAELNAIWKKEGRPELDIGIGLNSAEVIFGNVGAGKKLDFTVIGDGVNLAARLEGANKEYATHIIISEFTQAELSPEARVRPLGEIIVKGKTVPVSIFELLALPD